jgi:hypothetical protein
MITYEEIVKMVREDTQYITESDHPDDLLNSWAQSCVPIYSAVIQQEWCALDFEHQNRWQECFSLKDLGEDKGIEYLMTIDLSFYYEGLFDRAWCEVEKELEAFPMCQHPAPADFGTSQVKNGTLVHDCADCGLVMAWSITSL